MNKKTEAKCNGQILTVGFHSSEPPLIWRFDLERNHSFTLSLQGEDGDWELGVTSIKDVFYSVAHFSAREDAEEALGKVEKALAYRKGAPTPLVKVLAGTGVLALLIGVGVGLFALYLDHATFVIPQSALAPAPAHTAESQPGMPQSADDVLQVPK